MTNRDRQSSRAESARLLVIAGSTVGALGVAGAIGVGIHTGAQSDTADTTATDNGSTQGDQQYAPSTGQGDDDGGGTLVRPSRPRPPQGNNAAPNNNGASTNGSSTSGGGSQASSGGS